MEPAEPYLPPPDFKGPLMDSVNLSNLNPILSRRVLTARLRGRIMQ